MMGLLIVGGSARAQTTNRVFVVNVETAEVFYVRDNKPVALDHAPKGTEVVVEKTILGNAFCQYRGRPAYIHRDLLVTKQEFYVAAQKARGLVEYRGQWLTPEEKFRQEQIAKGLVLYKGAWVTPAEKFQQEQIAKGLVAYQGQWVTPVDKFRREQLAKGLVLWKDLWVTPEAMQEAQRAEFEAAQRTKGLTLHNGAWIPIEMLNYLDNAKRMIEEADGLFAQQKEYTRVQNLYKQAVASLQKYSELRNRRNTPDPEALALCSRVATNTAEIMKMIHDGTLTVLPDGQLVPKVTNVTDQATAQTPKP
jgi:hypothetical protein